MRNTIWKLAQKMTIVQLVAMVMILTMVSCTEVKKKTKACVESPAPIHQVALR